MGNPNLLDPGVRSNILQEINQEENHSRKREHQKRFDVYRERQDRYILERLQREFNHDTVDQMRKIFSVNLTKRIVDEMSGIYNNPPERNFTSMTRETLSEQEENQLIALYDECRVNVAMKKANEFYNLHDQCAIMIVPDMRGNIKFKAVPPLHYDVIPQADDAEKAYAYILNVWDFDLHKTVRDENSETTQMNRYRLNDRRNQRIADDSDRNAAQERYVVWTDEVHFTMDGKGNIVEGPIDNPIKRLPFVDVADDKDFQFFVRRGTSVVDFALDLGLVLSDTSNTIRLQNYSQAIMTSEKQPQNLVVGPNNVLWLPLDPNNPGATPRFEFASPSPDIGGSLEFLDVLINLFMASRGLDQSTISGKGDGRSFGSGVERLLAMLDKFEATRSDFDLFKRVEMECYEILVAWSNRFQDVVGEGELREDLRLGRIGDDVFMDIKFSEPVATQTQIEKEQSVYGRMERGLMSRKTAIMKLDEVSEEKAIEELMEIDSEPQLFIEEEDSGEIQNGTAEVSEESEQSEAEG